MGYGAAWSPSLRGGSVYRQRTAVSQDRDRASGEVFQEGLRKALAKDAFLPGRESKAEPSGAARRFYVDASGRETPVLKSC